MNPRVTVVMPVYNGSKFLDKALPSVLAQSLRDFELIIVDDCSKDDSFEALQRWAGRDSRIVLHRNEKNRGIFGTLNRLLGLCRTDVLKIFCQDDVMMPTCLERQLAFMEENPQLAFARCLGTQEMGPKPTNKGPYRFERQLPAIINPPAAALTFFTFGCLMGNLTNLVCRKKALVESGGFDESLPYSGDFEMWVRTSSRYSFGLQREPLVYVHGHDQQGSVTLNRHNELIAQMDRVMEGLYRRVPAESRACCRLHASLTVVVNYVSTTLRRLFERKWSAVARLASPREYAYPLPICIFFYFMTLGMRLGYQPTTRRLLRKIESLNNSVPAGSVI